MKLSRLLKTVSLGVLTVGISGCFAYYDYNSANNYGSRRDAPPENNSRAYQTQQQYATVSHKVTNLQLNQTLSDMVQGMSGVNSAIVMMGDNIAYVAITIDNTAFGTRSGRADAVPGHGSETNNYGLVRGLYNTYDQGNDYADPNQLIPGVQGADTVMHHEYLSHMFKQKIAEKIRMAQPSVQDVYISANRDYVNEFNAIAQEAWQGRPLEPYRERFVSLNERIFGTGVTIPTQTENNGR
ncbi:YhcN/YlaJ family sporulation lipoprotein [Paenibacillus silviterrae]|uniref:YhcN/YlaJ family sporulation lipoprotein n=1 Tax=Paenibacillus silviterrae TaxID=3242194 RepID=UPI002542DBF6|nr:YhcN/YlaJ family sporulation lipoprotein [Paenibacillus chinjuensis]